MNILALVAHPRISESRLHRAWANALEASPKVSVRKLYQVYPYWQIDVPVEQKSLQAADRVVFQFPFYLYSCPPLMKIWLDDVLAFRWAYGPGGTALRGKQFLIAISTGGPAESFLPGGYHSYSVDELLTPFRQIANLVGAHYLKPHVFHRARTVSDAEIAVAAADYVQTVINPRLEVLTGR